MPIKPRPEVMRFARQMEYILRDNDYKGGWNNMSMDELYYRAREEMRELREALDRWMDDDGYILITKEAADVANYMLMIADIAWSWRQRA